MDIPLFCFIAETLSKTSSELTYSMDSAAVKTSPALASLNVPNWMRSSTDDCYYDTEISRGTVNFMYTAKLFFVL